MRISYDFFCVWNIIRDKNCHTYFGLIRWIVQKFHQFLYIQLLNISFLSKSCVKSCHSNCSNCLLWLFRREPSKKKSFSKEVISQKMRDSFLSYSRKHTQYLIVLSDFRTFPSLCSFFSSQILTCSSSKPLAIINAKVVPRDIWSQKSIHNHKKTYSAQKPKVPKSASFFRGNFRDKFFILQQTYWFMY